MYWRQEQLLLEQLGPLDSRRLSRLKFATATLVAGWTLLALTGVSTIYVAVMPALFILALVVAAGLIVAGTIAYMLARPAARRLVWPPGLQGATA
ncbi:MAG: hypothetical protein SFV15_22700 [Polyangiaceae bacterium]|nr:hypothetical protein [Polyangiaceae bacterium]